MSGSTAKATRRDIRRAVGEKATSIIGHTAQTVVQLAPEVARHGATISDFGRELDSHARQLTSHHERLQRLETESRTRATLTFAGRLRWLLKGR